MVLFLLEEMRRSGLPHFVLGYDDEKAHRQVPVRREEWGLIQMASFGHVQLSFGTTVPFRLEIAWSMSDMSSQNLWP